MDKPALLLRVQLMMMLVEIGQEEITALKADLPTNPSLLARLGRQQIQLLTDLKALIDLYIDDDDDLRSRWEAGLYGIGLYALLSELHIAFPGGES